MTNTISLVCDNKYGNIYIANGRIYRVLREQVMGGFLMELEPCTLPILYRRIYATSTEAHNEGRRYLLTGEYDGTRV